MRNTLLSIVVVAVLAHCASLFADEIAVALPAGVTAEWDIAKAVRQTTPTRERICINGLWRWQPARGDADKPPAKNWGYFKVPGCWPGITDYMQKDCQTVFAHPSWKNEKLASTTAAWYEREIEVPSNWAGRRIALAAEYVNSYAAVFVDGKKAGEIRFPGGEADLTAACRPGKKHLLSLLVIAMPLKEALLSYQDTNHARKQRATVPRRGLCGDVFLESTPAGPRITDVKIETSVRHGEITFDAAIANLPADANVFLRVALRELGQPSDEPISLPFKAGNLKAGRFAFTVKWKPNNLWDIDTPKAMCEADVSLVRVGGQLLDEAQPVRFGFREFWIDGRDFYLNGSRIFLSAVPVANAAIGAAWANYDAARETFARLKSFGINFVYTQNYDCEPGSHLGFSEILRAADDAGVLVSMTQPHFSHYDWKKPDADQNNGYARIAEFYVHAAGNHPSVVAYAMSHNATGYDEDMNPDLIDGIHAPRERWASNNLKLAKRAEAIVHRLDPSRIVYHHASGNLGVMHDSNFYPNFAPIQELDDWFEHWATVGVKPMFTCEYAAPMSWDWGMYRGFYKGHREWGSAKVPWEFCLAEWNSQFLGDAAFHPSPQETQSQKQYLRWEAKQWRTGEGWHRWDSPLGVDSKAYDSRYDVMAKYLTDNWRAYRTWGVSGISPWLHEFFWRLRDGVDRSRKNLAVDWEHLQRPGFSPDYLGQRLERMDVAFDRKDWIPTPAAEAMYRNNMPLLAYIAGKPKAFTSKDHIFYPGETIEKQLVIINNSRRTVVYNCDWSLAGGGDIRGNGGGTIPTGEQRRIPIKIELPGSQAPGWRGLQAHVRFVQKNIGWGDALPDPILKIDTQDDGFSIFVLPRPSAIQLGTSVALFDPKGETSAILRQLGVETVPINATDDLSAERFSKIDTLIVGKSALSLDGPAPSIARVRDGLRVIVFEQSPDVLEKRFGFRVAQYGLRQVFPRVADHPLLAGLTADNLRDWRGASTILPPRLDYKMRPMIGPSIEWCGMPVTQIWRCGNRGDVASALIEKPACGDFRPIVDGGFSLQYSPLMEYREGRGMILFCQLDVTGRTESDPAAETLVANMLRYVSTWKPSPRRSAVYAGETAGREWLDSAGIHAREFDGKALSPDDVLIVGPGGGERLKSAAPAIANWLKSGGRMLGVGLTEQDAAALPSLKIAVKDQEHIGTYFKAFDASSPFAGIGPADVYNRDPREMPLVAGGAKAIGDGILATAESGNVVLCQLVPWQFDKRQYHLKKTFRRASFLLSRLLANMGVAASPPILARFQSPVDSAKHEQRWLTGLYLDTPEEWDDPYRFFRW